MATLQKAKPWVLYDGSCGFCNRWIRFCAPILRSYGYELAPLQSSWVRKTVNLDEVELLEDFRVLLSDGTQVRGADAYRHVLWSIWWLRPVYVLSKLPGSRGFFDWAYRKIADRRFNLSRSCFVSPKA